MAPLTQNVDLELLPGRPTLRVHYGDIVSGKLDRPHRRLPLYSVIWHTLNSDPALALTAAIKPVGQRCHLMIGWIEISVDAPILVGLTERRSDIEIGQSKRLRPGRVSAGSGRGFGVFPLRTNGSQWLPAR